MKIHADKIDTKPPHAIRINDVRRILATLPAEWTDRISEVRLSNSLELHSCAIFSCHDGLLTIYSRRGSAKDALVAILSELAAMALGMNTRNCHRRSAAESRRLAQVIGPFVNEILPTLVPVRKRPSFPPPPSFRAVTFTFENE